MRTTTIRTGCIWRGKPGEATIKCQTETVLNGFLFDHSRPFESETVRRDCKA